MRTSTAVTLLAFVGIALLCIGSGSGNRTATGSPYGVVYLKAGDGWHPLEAIVDSAWQFLASRANPPSEARRMAAVWIDRDATNQLARVVFGGKVGSQFWEVDVGVGGKPVSFVTGFGVDRTEHRLLK
jgi:hypothetical protein